MLSLTCALIRRCVLVGWDVDSEGHRGFSLGQPSHSLWGVGACVRTVLIMWGG